MGLQRSDGQSQIPTQPDALVAKIPSATGAASGEDWQRLQDEVAGCVKCALAATRTRTVFGVGNPNADWLVIGEAPGAEEDQEGPPPRRRPPPDSSADDDPRYRY